MKRIWVLPLGLVLSSGCAVSEDEFKDRYVQAACDMMFECEPDAEKFFTDVDACVTTFQDLFDVSTEGCTYDAELGKACLDFVENAECEDEDTEGVCSGVFHGDDCDGI